MTHNLNVNKLHQCSKIADEFRTDSGEAEKLPYEDITVMKTEVKEEQYDSEMSADDIAFINVKEQYVSSPENNFEKESFESTEESLKEHRDTEKGDQKTHVVTKHSAESNEYKCTECNYATHMKQYLAQHMRVHSNDRPYKCSYKICKCLPGQEKHCKCEPCGYTSKRCRNLKEHVLHKHGSRVKNYKCEECEYATHTKHYLMKHNRAHRNGKLLKCTYKNCKCTPEQEESCECDTCDYATTTNSSLKAHVLENHCTEFKKYKCKNCDYATTVKVALVIHNRTHTDDDTPFKCPYKKCKCAPEQDQSCRCLTCGYASTNNFNLQQHIMRMHSTELKKYKCENCNYSTHFKTSLVLHNHTHTGYRPFKCTYKNCKCTSGQTKSCECDACGYTSITKYNLKRHMMRIHNVFDVENVKD